MRRRVYWSENSEKTQSNKVLWIISVFCAIHTADTQWNTVTSDYLRIIRCLFKALTGFRGYSRLHLVLSSIRGETLQWEVQRCWRLQLVLHYTIHILNVCLYPYLSIMQSERLLLNCHLWPARIYHIFTHKVHDFRKKNNEHKMFWFSVQI